MSHKHEDNTLKTGLVLNSGFTIFELVVGFLTGSLALIADGTHNLTDSLTLAIAYIADRISKKRPDVRRTYGYGRVKVIASLINAAILIAVAIFIGIESVQRLSEPAEVPGLVIASVAAVGIIINGVVAYQLSKRRHDLNVRSAFTNMLYDTLSSIGALIAGLAIYLFGVTWLDSVVGMGIAIMLLIATFGIIRDAFKILLEGTPESVDIEEVNAVLLTITGVVGTDDLHAWTIDNDELAFSCHLIINKKSLTDSRDITEQAKELLASKFGLTHSTIEIELTEDVNRTAHDHA